MIIVTNVEAQRQDGTTPAVVVDADLENITGPAGVEDPVDELGLPVHEDEQEWERLAAQAAAESGWRIVGPWRQHPTSPAVVAAPVARDVPFAAHVITADTGLGDPEVVVMTRADETGAADPVIDLPLPDGADPMRLLADHGWRVVGEATHDPYTIVGVEPVDWPALVEKVTALRQVAQAEAQRRDTAWRRVVSDAMRADGVPRQAVIDAAGVSPSRAYQIRDGVSR